MLIFAAKKCECIYESGYEVISLHTTKKGAYESCRAWWVDEWEKWNHDVSGDGYHGGYSSKERRKYHGITTENKRWAVSTYAVNDNHAIMAYAAKSNDSPGYKSIVIDYGDDNERVSKQVSGWIAAGYKVERVTLDCARIGIAEFLKSIGCNLEVANRTTVPHFLQGSEIEVVRWPELG